MIKLINEGEKVQPTANPTAAPEVSEEDKDKLVKSSLATVVNSTINNLWNNISDLDSLTATLNFDYTGEDQEDIQTVVTGIIDELTISIGMLYKLNDILDVEKADLIADGKDKAEVIIDGSDIEAEPEEIEDEEEPEEEESKEESEDKEDEEDNSDDDNIDEE